MTDFDQELDTSGLSCPMPILKSKKALKGLDIGKVLKIISTDPGSKKDIASWVNVTGQELLEEAEEGGKFVYFVKRLK
ncbi:MAG: sulfurtransferase TusA family protein [Candidatus Heimdallarchaeota archaeon]|nr:sulfurtransferase TusA family protein [Candidatus Heimdallarchaeota archaeon]